MDISVFLAKALGIYCLVLGIGFALNMQRIRDCVREMTKSPTLMLFSGLLALIIGILVVLNHNIWEADWRVVITLLGWIALFKGIVRIVFPQFPVKYDTKMMDCTKTYYTVTAITILLGLYFSYMGFFAAV